ncbi:hypothetical protein QE364_000758 [Nocardioides zeae]|uniref:Uncharacterized protein n=1 Tax=Nocardioides zeae TaxID=1457234 RepID=A0ACC6IEA5_9ACTN|nr:hypothetical protein [Nocardioides zeae]MDR6174261.1 hypothetical protein [Nocardioides zeae]MDR6209066.1 hypothetical protein [Nocardioides zeae]
MPPETPDTPDETGPDPVLDPATAAAVRRLLAEARHDEPVPPAVAARLDATLAGLRAERGGSTAPVAPPALPPRPGGDAPIDLAAQRRRRRGSLLLAAAAAVVVVGVGGVVVPRLGGSGDDVTSFDSGGQSEGDPGTGQLPQQPSPEGNPEEEGPDASALPPPTAEDRIVAAAGGLAAYDGTLLDGDGRTLSSSSLDDDLAALLGRVAADPEPAVPTGCGADPADGAVGVVSELDGENVVVEVTPTPGGAAVRVLGCDGEPRQEEQYGAE